jgi:uncharacterized protein YxjI
MDVQARTAGVAALFGRRRRQERRFDRAATRYKMRQRMISIGDDYVIENEQGEQVYRLDGKALRIRKTILFEDMDGHEPCKIQERMLHLRDSMEIEGPDGHRIAMVHKAMITPLRERWVVNVEDGPDLQAQGNIVDHEYTLERAGEKIAGVSKRWFRARDTCGVEVAPGENDVLVLATTAVMDTMAHPGPGSARDLGQLGAGRELPEPACCTGSQPAPILLSPGSGTAKLRGPAAVTGRASGLRFLRGGRGDLNPRPPGPQPGALTN